MTDKVFVDTNVLVYGRDSLIVSAAQVCECRYLLTEDLSENQNIGNILVINPFHTQPEAIRL